MPANPYRLLRPLLFALDAEAAHEMTLAALQNRACRKALALLPGTGAVQDVLELAGLRFANRVGLAAGLDKNARCIPAWAALGFGFVEVGTVTPRAQAGNPRPRLFRLPQHQALINRMGFNNDGLDAFLANVQRQARPPGLLLGLNIGKNADTPLENAASDYLLALDGIYPHADYVALNISSPNTRNLRALQGDAVLDALLAQMTAQRAQLAAHHGRHVPLFVKIAPDLDAAQIALIAASLQRHGMDGVIATNTTTARDGVQGAAHANEAGGLSGAPLREASNRVIRQLRAALGPRFPIIGAGGILSAQDAVEKIQAGADVVQLFSGLIYHGPALVQQAARAIAALRA